MKKLITIILLACTVFSCNKEDFLFPTTNCYWRDAAAENPKDQIYQDMIDDLVPRGIPGVNLLISKENRPIWISSGGLAEIESGVSLSPCHIMPLGELSSLYCRVAVLLMVDEGLLSLDSTLDDYLPDEVSTRIPNGQSATILDLLNNSSGIPDYDDQYLLDLDLLNNKNMDYSQETLLEQYVFDRPTLFKAGSKVAYSNSNFEILTMIMDRVYPKGHTAFYSYRLFSRMGLEKTYYKEETDYFSLYANSMANGYFDRHGDGKIENATDLALTISSGQTGSMGMVANLPDLYTFIQTALSAQFLTAESHEILLNGLEIQNQNFSHHADRVFGLVGHIPGFTSKLWYFPSHKVLIMYSMNSGNLHSNELERWVDEEFDYNLIQAVLNE